MNQKRIQVPPGMLEAACLVAYDNLASHEHNRRIILEAALRWLDAQLEEMDKVEPFDRDLQIDRVRALWLAPEPEAPDAIKDLLWEGDPGGSYNDEHNQQILEAYRRGKQAK